MQQFRYTLTIDSSTLTVEEDMCNRNSPERVRSRVMFTTTAAPLFISLDLVYIDTASVVSISGLQNVYKKASIPTSILQLDSFPQPQASLAIQSNHPSLR